MSHSNVHGRLEQTSLQTQRMSGLPFSNMLAADMVVSILAQQIGPTFRERVFSPIIYLVDVPLAVPFARSLVPRGGGARRGLENG